MEEYTVLRGQNTYDVAIQVYGSTNFITRLVNDNSIQLDTILTEGQKLTFDPTIGDSLIKAKIANNNIVILNTGR